MIGRNDNIEFKINFPPLWSIIFGIYLFLGCEVNSGEYKLMGLAPYGKTKYKKYFKELINLKEDGSFNLNLKYFDYCTGLTMTNLKFENLE